MEDNEERYEHIDILIKSPEGDESWFDRLFDFITSFCSDELWGEDENGEWAEIGECTCGMESMGGSSGTLDQCYEHMRITEKWAQDVQAADLKLILREVFPLVFPVNDDAHWVDGADWSTPPELRQAYERLRKAAYWHDDFNERYSNLEDEEDADGTTDI